MCQSDAPPNLHNEEICQVVKVANLLYMYKWCTTIIDQSTFLSNMKDGMSACRYQTMPIFITLGILDPGDLSATQLISLCCPSRGFHPLLWLTSNMNAKLTWPYIAIRIGSIAFHSMHSNRKCCTTLDFTCDSALNHDIVGCCRHIPVDDVLGYTYYDIGGDVSWTVNCWGFII